MTDDNLHVWYDPEYNKIWVSHWFHDKNIMGRYIIEVTSSHGTCIAHDSLYCVYLGRL